MPKSTVPALPRSTVDRPDDGGGSQIHLMYVLPSDGVDEQADTNGRIGTSAVAFNRWLFAQAPGRAFRIDTYNGLPDITFFRMSRTDAEIRATGAFVRNLIEFDLIAAGMIRENKLYAVYYGGSSNYSCGGGAYPPTLVGVVGAIYLKGEPPGSIPCPTNSLGLSIESPGYFEFAIIHELMHTLGFVATCAPHFVSQGHVSDSPNDLMWTGDAPWQLPPRLDIGRDDYYQHGIAGCLDFSASPYLAQVSYEGLWLKTDESGWGLNIAHQGNIFFATWFTYDTDGSGLWLVMSGGTQTGPSSFSGPLYRTTGPAFNATPFMPITFPANYTQVGTLSLSFIDANTGTMSYTVNGVTQSKPITRYLFASGGANCTLGATQGASPNYQDLWLKADEAGWGVNLAHQGDILFATWFTYQAGGKGQWLVMSNGSRTAPGVYTGTLQRTTGPAFSAVPFNPNNVTRTNVGSATFTFNNANNGTFAYTLDGISQSKPITRYIFASPASACQ